MRSTKAFVDGFTFLRAISRAFVTAGLLAALTACGSETKKPENSELQLGAQSQTAKTVSAPSANELALAENIKNWQTLEKRNLVKVRLNTKKTVQSFSFGSCAHQKKPQPIWKAMSERHPDFYLSLGDTVYASKSEDQPIALAYTLQAHHPDFQIIRETTPIIGAWDDHDFGENDGGVSNKMQRQAKAEYLKHMINDAGKISPKIKGNYHSFMLGNFPQSLQIIILDTRTYRDALEKNEHPKHELDIYQPTQDTRKTFLGEEQWRWLDQQLQKKAGLRIIASSVQFIAEEHGFEKWSNFPHERDRLLKLLKKHQTKNILFLSGDRHSGEFDKMSLPDLGTIWEVTSSGINRNSTIKEEPNKYRLTPLFTQSNFGTVSIDWSQKTALLQLIDQSNTVLHQEVFKF